MLQNHVEWQLLDLEDCEEIGKSTSRYVWPIMTPPTVALLLISEPLQ